MRTHLQRLITLLGVVALLLPSLAEDPLTLRACIDLALRQETSVLVGQTTVESARARETRAKSSYYPQVGISATSVLQSAGAPLGQRNGTSLTISETFYDGGVRNAALRGAKANVGQQQADLARTQQTVVYQVTSRYCALLRAQQLAEVQKSRAGYLEGAKALMQGRIDAGDAAEADLLPVEAQLENARVDLLAAKNAIRTAAVQLQHTMGVATQSDFAIAEITTPPSATPLILEESLQAALASRPEVVASQYSITAARSSTDSAELTLRPRLVVNGQYNQPMLSGDPNGTAITGGIVYDLFDGGSNRAAYREAQVAQTAAELRAAQVTKDIRADVETALLNIENARERMTASAVSLAAAQKNYDAQEGRYKQGLAIPLDLLNAQVNVATAQSNVVQARYDYYASYAQLEYAIGKQGGLYAN